MRIRQTDINFGPTGFSVPIITKATNKKLSMLEDMLCMYVGYPVSWANVEDMGILSVSWARGHVLTEEEKKKVLLVLIILFKNIKP